MASTTGGANAVCPFFLREVGKSVSCETFSTGVSELIRFESEAQKADWMRLHCQSFDYAKRCPYAAMMIELYE